MDGKQLAKRYDEMKLEVQFLRARGMDLEQELRVMRPELYRAHQQVGELEERVQTLTQENAVLQKRVAELSGQLDRQPKPVPAFVKANVPKSKRRRPGRKPGHALAQRAVPEKIDQHIEVPVVRDSGGAVSCPACNCQLSEVQQHQRIVEDIEPSRAVTRCYRTVSGYCPSCRKHIESRAPEQPPASNISGSQIGLNALTTAALMRVQYRLPYRMISQLLADLPGLSISPGAVARQVQRMGDWLEGEYNRLRIFLRHSPVVHMDETAWRVDGHNQWLWAVLDPTHTLFHVDKSRSQKVVRELLGDVFGGTLVSDFYSGYAAIDCRKQKCLVHLLRELRDTAKQDAAFGRGPFCRRLKRLLKEMLLLKGCKKKMSAVAYRVRGERMEERLRKLAVARWAHADAQRLAARLRKHAKELTVFLWDDSVDGSNNAAERAVRPAVVMRKITGGSRSERGARATAVLMSMVRTIRQQERPLFETIRTLIMNAWAGKNPGLLTDVLVNSS